MSRVFDDSRECARDVAGVTSLLFSPKDASTEWKVARLASVAR